MFSIPPGMTLQQMLKVMQGKPEAKETAAAEERPSRLRAKPSAKPES